MHASETLILEDSNTLGVYVGGRIAVGCSGRLGSCRWLVRLRFRRQGTCPGRVRPRPRVWPVRFHGRRCHDSRSRRLRRFAATCESIGWSRHGNNLGNWTRESSRGWCLHAWRPVRSCEEALAKRNSGQKSDDRHSDSNRLSRALFQAGGGSHIHCRRQLFCRLWYRVSRHSLLYGECRRNRQRWPRTRHVLPCAVEQTRKLRHPTRTRAFDPRSHRLRTRDVDCGFDLESQLARAREATVGVAIQCAHHDLVQLAWDSLIDRAGGRHRLTQNALDCLRIGHARRLKESFPGEHLPKDDPGGKHVRAPIHDPAANLLGRTIPMLARKLTGRSYVDMGLRFCDSKIENLGVPFGTHHDVLR